MGCIRPAGALLRRTAYRVSDTIAVKGKRRLLREGQGGEGDAALLEPADSLNST
jgi:hypothetical protein